MAEQQTRRRHRRCDWNREAIVVGRRGVYRGYVGNISESGIAVALPKNFADSLVSIEIPGFLGHATMLLRAVRRHDTEGLCGFEFTSVTPTQAAMLRGLCDPCDG